MPGSSGDVAIARIALVHREQAFGASNQACGFKPKFPPELAQVQSTISGMSAPYLSI